MNSLARERSKADILRRLQAVRPDSTRRWGRMSAHQMVCHLTDSCRMAMGEKPVSVATGPLQRTVVKWIALYLPLPWPSGVPTRPEIDQEASGTCPSDFTADVAELEALRELMTGRRGRMDWPSHPIFGRMSESEWLRWAYLHMDHHFRQFGV
jgi:Protein of unknown function (DUF1569)